MIDTNDSMVASNWLILTALALTFSLVHFFIDTQIGLFGFTSTIILPVQVINILITAVLFGVWAYALGLGGRRSRTGLVTAFLLSLLWAALANGVVALIVAPPPSAGFPYQDVAHVLSLIFGGLGAYATWQVTKNTSGPVRLALPVLAVALVVGALVGQGLVVL